MNFSKKMTLGKIRQMTTNKAKSGVIWLTGLAGAGKTTFASELFKHLKELHGNVILLDGDVFRRIFGESGYEKAQRLITAHKLHALTAFLEQNDLIVIIAAIAAFDEIYTLNRKNFKNYFEIYIKCDFDELVRRDKKGLYSGALRGEVKNVMGVDIEYDKPKAHFVLENHHATNFTKNYTQKIHKNTQILQTANFLSRSKQSKINLVLNNAISLLTAFSFFKFIILCEFNKEKIQRSFYAKK